MGLEDVEEELFMNDIGPVSNDVSPFNFSDDSALALAFEGKSFNFWAALDGEIELLYSAAFSGGAIDVASQSADIDFGSAFDVVMRGSTLYELLEDPSLWPSYAMDPSRVTLARSDPEITDLQALCE